MEVSGQIGAYKLKNNVAVVQLDRWNQLLADHLATGQDMGLPPELVNKVFEAIHQASIQRQSELFDEA